VYLSETQRLVYPTMAGILKIARLKFNRTKKGYNNLQKLNK